MKFYIRLLVGFVIGFVLLAMIGAVILRESLGGQYRFDYKSPSHPEYHVEIYEHPGFGGDPLAFSLFVVDSGVRKYLGDLGADPNSAWTEDLSWSKDGNLVYCRDHDYRTAYVFGEKNDNAPTESSGAKQVVLLLAEHGGPGISFFDYKFDSTTLVWRDFVPSENN